MLAAHATIAQVTRQLDVTMMTLHLWRRGTPQRPPMPVSVARQGKAKRIIIHRSDLEAWLERWRPDLLEKLREGAGNDNRSVGA